MQIIDGKKIANNILAGLKKEIKLKKSEPRLAIILVGDNSSSLLYIKAKEKAAARIGVKIKKILLPKESLESQILKVIRELNNNSNINGILVQLPLPKGISPAKIIKEINPEKDIDGLLPNSGFNSPFILSIWEALETTKENLENKKIVALVNSEIFGKRLSSFFKRKGLKINYTVIASLEKQSCRINAGLPRSARNDKRVSLPGINSLSLRGVCDAAISLSFPSLFRFARNDGMLAVIQKADVLITALGRPWLIKGDTIKKDAILIDGGINRVDGKIAGDIDMESIKQKAKWLAPVPGGLGPITVAFLLKNLTKTYLRDRVP
ncbi:MAG: bifunctional 5,10-methylenetetrahydrofolate dehydrogenase/5,10-methenyltetrahydrofolate cyclohydrolase [Patescibacteria group bacterium]|nr:bifunctional 5,10-methylenetetrahydrofolate dehydrogenase/5,10-methenyltetrahydrofolate cyclohydrolase [Patescibacteria group bacterium]